MASEPNQMRTFDARKLMEIAVEMMKQSIPEDRGDSKIPPAVGAAIWIPDEKRYETAYRGELRDGDHGEYTLLERKLSHRKLDDCILFTTLEPCMERNIPKCPCAKRILKARIKTVYVGIEDPDVTVDGKGIELLRSKGVKVEMFERDLQDEIERVNEKFIMNANERKETEVEEGIPKPFLESTVVHVDWSALSSDALLSFHTRAQITESIKSVEFHNRLQRLLIVDESDNPTNNGIILFGIKPRESIPEAAVLGTIYYENTSDESRDFDGPQVEVPEEILEWLKNKLPKPDSRSGAVRKDKDDAFFELVREAVVNAIVHRDYSISGTKIQVTATANVVTIKSPGYPVEPITIEQLKKLEAPMRSRNPTLHYIFNRMRLAEERGLGLKSMKITAEHAGLPKPEFSWENPYLVLRLYRSEAGIEEHLPSAALANLNESELTGYKWLKTQGWISRPDYEKSQQLGTRAAGLHLRKFYDLGIVERQGKGKAIKHRAK
ncbi:MAG: ATP-binding protein [Planctomycetota bacterium]